MDRTSLPEQVFRSLVDDVIGGRYAPGDRLPAQRSLAADLGVNMASVREGIKRLEQLRLVDVRHGEAMRVRDWRADGGLDVLAYAAGDPGVVRSLFEARRLLLTEAARMAAERRSDDDARQLGEIAEAFVAAETEEDAQLIDLAFFATVIGAAGNLVFTLIMNSIRAIYEAGPEPFRPIVARRGELVPLYRAAAAAIAQADPGRAADAVQDLAAAQERRMTEAAG